MPNLYARATALPDVCGRIDYISNPKRQEHLLAFCDSTADLIDGQFWHVLARESRQAYEMYGQKSRQVKDPKTGEMVEKELRCCQGREIQIALSNSLLDRMDPHEVAQILVDEFQEKLGLHVAAAIHLNKKENNLHAHVILPERQLLEEPVIKTAERNLFFDADGRRRYKKAEILDENKQLLPGCRIVKKGEIYEQRYFSAVEPEYSYKRWLTDVKTNVILPLRNGKLRGDIDITEYDPSTGKLAQQHIGVVDRVDWPSAKAKVADIRKYNNLVKEFNQLIDDKRISLEEALAVQAEVNHLPEKTAILEARMIEFRERENNLRRAAEEEEKKWYSHKNWMRDRDNRYKIYRYDINGRKRSTTELILLLAVTIIDNEFRKKDAAVPQPQYIYARKDWKVQQMIDSIELAQREHIDNPLQIEDRLHEVGAELSRARAEVKRLSASMDRMKPIMQAIQDYDALHQKCEKILSMPDRGMEKYVLLASEAANLERYKQAKANMYQTGVAAPEGRQAFLERYSVLDESLQRATQTENETKKRYTNLKKLDYNLNMAEHERYCYDPRWLPEELEKHLQNKVLDEQSQEELQKPKKKTWSGADDQGGIGDGR